MGRHRQTCSDTCRQAWARLRRRGRLEEAACGCMSVSDLVRPRYWTEADAAELALLGHELVEGLDAHRAKCATCRALQNGPCPERGRLVDEWRPYDLQPLAAPPGFLADLRRRLAEHEDGCSTCAAISPGRCTVVDVAIAVVVDWRRRRELLTRAQVLRRVWDRKLEALACDAA
jgi:hypothetical protein